MASIRRSFTIFSTATKSLTSRDKNGPLSKSSLSGCVLCPAAITFADPNLFRKAGTSSEPIWPVAPVTNIRFIIYPLSLFIQNVITSHTCVAPRLVVAAYAKNTPHSSPSSRLGLLCSYALYAALFMSLCIKTEKSNEAQQKPPQAVVYLLSYPVFLLSLSADECFQSPFLIEVPLKHPPFLLCAVFYE